MGQGVGDRDREVSGVALVARWADVGEANGGGPADGQDLRGPDLRVHGVGASVEVLTIIILGYLEVLSVDGKTAGAETVGVATDGATEVGVVVDVAFDVVVAQGDLADFAPAVGYTDGSEGGTVFTDRYAHTAAVIQDM